MTLTKSLAAGQAFVVLELDVAVPITIASHLPYVANTIYDGSGAPERNPWEGISMRSTGWGSA